MTRRDFSTGVSNYGLKGALRGLMYDAMGSLTVCARCGDIPAWVRQVGLKRHRQNLPSNAQINGVCTESVLILPTFFMPTTPEAGRTHPTLQPQSDRTNMTTPGHKKQNL